MEKVKYSIKFIKETKVVQIIEKKESYLINDPKLIERLDEIENLIKTNLNLALAAIEANKQKIEEYMKKKSEVLKMKIEIIKTNLLKKEQEVKTYQGILKGVEYCREAYRIHNDTTIVMKLDDEEKVFNDIEDIEVLRAYVKGFRFVKKYHYSRWLEINPDLQ